MRAGARSEFRRRRETDFWQTVNRALALLIAGGVVVAVLLTFIPEIRRDREMRTRLADMQRQVGEENLRLKQQQREEQLLLTDHEYLEIIARDRLGVMKDGETIFRLDANRTQEVETSSKQQ
jgi:cell division protein FtsB